MAGTVVTTEVIHGSVKKVTFAWTSSAGGAADATTTAAFDGKILHVVTVPSAVTAPTNLYDVVLEDDAGVDLLATNGANRSDTATEHILSANMGAVSKSTLTLGVTNAGNAKLGTVYVYLR